MIILSRKKNFINRILNPIKYIILSISGKYRDPKTGMMYIPTETEIDIYHNKGVKYLGKRKYAKAIDMFKKMIEYDKGDFLGYQRLGEVYQEIGNIEEARKNYEIALKNAEKRYKEAPYMREYKSIIKEIKGELTSVQ